MDWTFVLVLATSFPLLINCSEVRVVSSSSKIFHFTRNSSLSQDGYQLRNHVYQEFSTKYQVTQCAMECLASQKCKSFNFGRFTHVCQLNDASHEEYPDDFDHVIDADITEYHERGAFSIDKEALGPCHSFPCKNDGRCLDTRSALSGERIYLCLCQDGWRGDNCDMEDNRLEWAQWEEWGACSVSCGSGHQHRRRNCEDTKTGTPLSASQCWGRDEEYMACDYKACPKWDPWGEWSECSTFTTCGRGYRVRNRQCGNGGTAGVDRYCLGPQNETSVCHGINCNSMVRLRGGTEFGEGRVELYHNKSKKWFQVCGDKWDLPMADVACKQRGFLAANTALTNGSHGDDSDLETVELSCEGHEWTLQQCRRESKDKCVNKAAVQCKVKGAWSLWTGWSECSVTCEDGIRTRIRACDHPPPNFNGLPCPGSDTEHKNCTEIMCPIDGVWQPWTIWSPCSVTCANGTQSRSRNCTGPFHNGKDCEGDGKEIKECFPKMCPVDGEWESWEAWNACTVSCGYGSRQRSRICKGPYYDGAPCVGNGTDTEVCNAFSCPVDGAWRQWSDWGACNVTCGGGFQERYRVCDNPLHGGSECLGPSNQTQPCNTHNCPVDGLWMEWTGWTECSVTCANGTRSRNRTCNGPFHGGLDCSGEPFEEEVCVTLSCPVDGIWLAWSDWDACNVTCGGGGKRRYRQCDGPYFDGKDCKGPSDELVDCNMQPCPVDGVWTDWSLWTRCSLSCGTGSQSRNRTCEGTDHGGRDCEGVAEEVQDCNTDPCPVDGTWKLWTAWSACNASCAGGHSWRTRECNRPKHGGVTCPGSGLEMVECNTHPCPVDGVFGEWSVWTDCSLTCGNGTKQRTRECIGPLHNGTDCVGDREEEAFCNTFFCPVDGIWEQWSNWTECSQSCGRGHQSRTRDCIGPFYNGSDCVGVSMETQLCNPSNCPVDGIWMSWNQWSACDVTCGQGTRSRDRSCSGPFNGGLNCTGNDSETESCHPLNCPVDGFYMEWTTWTTCPVSCGGALRSRNRTCIGPFYDGKPCAGPAYEEEGCNETPCPVDGEWSFWSSWSQCNETCGGGYTHRYRYCTEAQHGGSNCPGEKEQYADCNTHPCPIDGIFSAWTSWSDCTASCGTGQKFRNRTCDGPYHGGNNCTGEWDKVMDCNTQECPIDGIFGEWSIWTDCSVTCSGGTRNRSRACIGPFFNGTPCIGDFDKEEDCNTEPCPEDGVWKSWTEWEECSKLCGGGSRWRSRECIGPSFEGQPCQGPSNESQACNTFECAVDGYWLEWGDWGECNVTCAGGIQTRTRECVEPVHGGQDCEGDPEEHRICNTQECPVDGVWTDWAPWGDCTVSCGGGNQTRLRNCTGPFHGGEDCHGADWDMQECNLHECPVDGVLDAWSTWYSCDVSCGGGVQWRNRSCIGPFYGGKPCDEDLKESQVCNTQECPVDGVWMAWGDWSQCNVTCGGGLRYRFRTCEGPFYGGLDCEGPALDEEDCNMHECPVDGVWMKWTAWESCDLSCGGGIQWRERWCDGPYFGGANCSGAKTESQDCNTHSCPVDGELQEWSTWTTCDVTCGGGVQHRNRTCLGPFHGGLDCQEPLNETRICNTDECPVDGVDWGPWTAWWPCSKTCDWGTQYRARTCHGPDCRGQQYGVKDCFIQSCPATRLGRAAYYRDGDAALFALLKNQRLDGVWQVWSTWEDCSVTCGGGISRRNRTCHGPFYGGADCQGSEVEERECATDPCPIPGDWMAWGGWSRCSVTCGGGTRTRTRVCDMDVHGDLTAPCLGDEEDREDCHTYPCQPYAQTCSELVQWGLLDSGNVTLQPKPDHNPIMPELPPCEVYCDLESENGIGVTVIGHDSEERTFVSGYEGKGDYKKYINYDISYDHIVAIVEHSKKCKQFLRWECYAATIKNPHMTDVWSTYWTKRGGIQADYFPGAVPGSGKCGCGQIGNCVNVSAACNCDINDQVWRSDEGFLTYKDDLPIYSFCAGDTGELDKEMGYFTIGKLTCYGAM